MKDSNLRIMIERWVKKEHRRSCRAVHFVDSCTMTLQSCWVSNTSNQQHR